MTGPLTDQRLDEIQTALAAVTTNRSTDLAERDRAYDRWGANSKQYAADLLDEIQRLRQQRDHLVSAFDKLSDQMGELVQAAQGERGRYVAENQRLREEADRLRAAWESAWAQRNEARDLLHRFAGHEDTPCRFDHHGDCQEHGSSGSCQVAEARRVLGLNGAEDAPQSRADGPPAGRQP